MLLLQVELIVGSFEVEVVVFDLVVNGGAFGFELSFGALTGAQARTTHNSS